MGLGLPADRAAGGDRARHGRAPRAVPRERGDRARRPPRRRPLDRARRRADPRDQLRAGPERDDARARAVRGVGRRAGRVLHPTAPRGEPALRPAHGCAPDLLGRGLRGADRLRVADGRDVRRPAVPPERPRLLDRRRRARDPARGRLHGRRRSAVGEDRRGPRRPVHAAVRLRLRPARLPDDAPALEGRHPVLEGRARLLVRRDRRRPRRDAGLALAHGLGPGEAGRDGLGHGRPPARPRRRDHAVDPRRAADGGLRDGRRHADRRLREERLEQHPGRADEVVRERGRHGDALPARDPEPDRRRSEDGLPPGRRVGVSRRDRRRPARGGARLLQVPEARAGAGAAGGIRLGRRRRRSRPGRWRFLPASGTFRGHVGRPVLGSGAARGGRPSGAPALVGASAAPLSGQGRRAGRPVLRVGEARVHLRLRRARRRDRLAAGGSRGVRPVALRARAVAGGARRRPALERLLGPSGRRRARADLREHARGPRRGVARSGGSCGAGSRSRASPGSRASSARSPSAPRSAPSSARSRWLWPGS